MKRKIIYILIPIIVIVFCSAYYFYLSKTSRQIISHYKCPEEYAEDTTGTTEYRNTLSDWTDSYFKTHPKATMSDWSKAMSQLWIDNNCTVAIQRSKQSGNVSDLRPWEKVDYEIQTILDKYTK